MNKPNPEKIEQMFSTIAKSYDRANTTLSAGIHHLWRQQLVNWSEIRGGDKVLDCATGTGDLAIAFKKQVGEFGQVIGSDFCEEMLKQAPKKAQKQKLQITFEKADVTQLPYSQDQFNLTSIAFGIRNVSDPIKALQEMSRVTKKGGHVMILEFGQPSTPGWKHLYSFYAKNILPMIGGWVSGKKSAYAYLEKSSAKFPCNENFVELAKSAKCFEQICFKKLAGGIAYIYKAKVC